MELELDALCQRMDSLRQEQAALRTHNIDRTEQRLDEAEQTYRRLGGTLYDQRESIEQRWGHAKQALKDGQVALRELAAGASPLLLVRSLLESVEMRDRREEATRRARHVNETLAERDSRIVERLCRELVEESTINALKEFLARDRQGRRTLGQQPTLLDFSQDARGDLHSLIRDGLNEERELGRGLLASQQQKETQASHAQMEYDSIPSPYVIAELVESQQQLRSELVRLQAKYSAMDSEIERHTQELLRKEKAFSRLLEADAKDKSYPDDQARILHHSRKARNTLTRFRRAVVRRHVGRIESLVLECYQQLLRKSSLVKALSIDPDDFSLNLVGRSGRTLGPEQLSAGERQLLAIALLWGGPAPFRWTV